MVRSVEPRKFSKRMAIGMVMIALLPFAVWQGATFVYNFSGLLSDSETVTSKSSLGYQLAKPALQVVGLDGAVTVYTFDGTTFYPVFTLPSGTKIRILQHTIVKEEVYALVRVVRTGEQGWVSQAVIEPVPGRKEIFPTILFSSGSPDAPDHLWKLGVPVTADAFWIQVDMSRVDEYDVFQFRVIAPNLISQRSDRFRRGTVEGHKLEVKLPVTEEMRVGGTWRVELVLNNRPAGLSSFRVHDNQ